MSNYLTPAEAREEWLCPLSRLFGSDKLTAGCRGPECAMWRWKPRNWTDGQHQAVIEREMICQAKDYNENRPAEKKERSPSSFHKTAVESVAKNPEGFGLTRDQGYCGLGGRPT